MAPSESLVQPPQQQQQEPREEDNVDTEAVPLLPFEQQPPREPASASLGHPQWFPKSVHDVPAAAFYFGVCFLIWLICHVFIIVMGVLGMTLELLQQLYIPLGMGFLLIMHYQIDRTPALSRRIPSALLSDPGQPWTRLLMVLVVLEVLMMVGLSPPFWMENNIFTFMPLLTFVLGKPLAIVWIVSRRIYLMLNRWRTSSAAIPPKELSAAGLTFGAAVIQGVELDDGSFRDVGAKMVYVCLMMAFYAGTLIFTFHYGRELVLRFKRWSEEQMKAQASAGEE